MYIYNNWLFLVLLSGDKDGDIPLFCQFVGWCLSLLGLLKQITIDWLKQRTFIPPCSEGWESKIWCLERPDS